MGVGDYVHSREAPPLRPPPRENASQSRQQLAEQARVEVPSSLAAPGPVPMAIRSPQFDQYGGQKQQHAPPAENAQRDMFDTDVEGVDDSTIAATSVLGYDDLRQPLAQYGSGQARPFDPQWYENLGDKAMKSAGFESEDGGDTASQLTSMAGDDERSEATQHSDHFPRRRGPSEEPLSKRLQSFWNASRKTTNANVQDNYQDHEEPPKNTPGDRTSHIPISTARKINLPPNGTPRTRFSPPKPSLLEQLGGELTPTHRTSGARPKHSRQPSIQGHSPNNLGEDGGLGLFTTNYTRQASDPPSFHAFDMTNLDALDDEDDLNNNTFIDPINDPFSRRDSVRHIGPDPGQSHSQSNKKRPITPDYPPEVLKKKTFAELQSESFDNTPHATRTTVTQPPSADAPEEDKMSFLTNLSDEERRSYFSNLTLDEWEDCGDLLIDQFGKMLTKMKEMRHARRQTAAVFEAEIKRRNDLVGEEAEEVGRKLQDMKKGGAEVLRGRTPG